MSDSQTLLSVRGLRVRYRGSPAPVIQDLDLELEAGQCLAVVGPSGCGKSTLCRALLDLLPPGARLDGSIRWEGRELMDDRDHWRRLRGRGLGLVLQDHRFALDPVRRVGDQVAAVVRRHQPELAAAGVRQTVHALLEEVSLPDPTALARRYPHQLSGGQRQRACLAAALAAGPRLLLADEPTTALDLLTQRDIIGLLGDLVTRRHLALLLVTHDDDIVRVVTSRVLHLPGATSPLSEKSSPSPAMVPATGSEAPAPCLRVRDLVVTVPTPRGPRRVVEPVSFDLVPGRTLGLAGESGAGKTSLARALAGWLPAAAGRIELDAPATLAAAARRRAVQMVSQDATAALDPRQRVLDAVSEAARAAGDSRELARQRARRLLAEVDLDPELEARRPDALSGGQRQRVQLARALAARPRVLVADEPASSLDSDRRLRLLGLMRRAQRQHGLALLLISHDLLLLEHWCDQIMVMHAGYLVELYRPGAVGQPRHPFARELAAAAPARLVEAAATDSPPIAATHPDHPAASSGASGCPYAGCCHLVQPSCRIELPQLRDQGHGHLLRCPLADRQAR